MAQVIERLCRDCRHFVPRSSAFKRGIFGISFFQAAPPCAPHTSAFSDRCSWRTDLVTGDPRLLTCDYERHVGHCGEDGSHFEPTTTQQGEP